MPILLIDIFAGLGGLGEGYMTLKDEVGKSVFYIKLSIEKDQNAHNTLIWISLFRQFVKDFREVPERPLRKQKILNFANDQILLNFNRLRINDN